MLLARGRFWRAGLHRKTDAVSSRVERDGPPEDLTAVRDLGIEISPSRRSRLLKTLHSHSERVGGVLSASTPPVDLLSRVIARDRIGIELQRVPLDATLATVEREALLLHTASHSEDA